MRDEPSIVGDVISGRNPSTPCVHDPVTCWWCQNPSVTPRVPYAKVEDMRRVKREMDAHNMNGGTVRLQAAEDGEC